MDYYAIIRRSAWNPEDVAQADARSNAELERLSGDVRKIRSYLLDESDSTMGTLCLYQATSPEAIREHAAAAGLPVDDIVRISAIDVHRPDPDMTNAAAH